MGGLIVGALLMIMHWLYGREIVFFSKLLFILSTFVHLLSAQRKTYGHWAGLVGIICYCIYLLNLESLLFLDDYLLLLVGLSWLFWYWDVGMEQGFVPNFKPISLKSSILIIIGVLLTAVGVLFKIQHYPYADILLISGMLLAALYMVVRK